jgi:hypothetical protein
MGAIKNAVLAAFFFLAMVTFSGCALKVTKPTDSPLVAAQKNLAALSVATDATVDTAITLHDAGAISKDVETTVLTYARAVIVANMAARKAFSTELGAEAKIDAARMALVQIVPMTSTVKDPKLTASLVALDAALRRAISSLRSN